MFAPVIRALFDACIVTCLLHALQTLTALTLGQRQVMCFNMLTPKFLIAVILPTSIERTVWCRLWTSDPTLCVSLMVNVGSGSYL